MASKRIGGIGRFVEFDIENDWQVQDGTLRWFIFGFGLEGRDFRAGIGVCGVTVAMNIRVRGED